MLELLILLLPLLSSIFAFFFSLKKNSKIVSFISISLLILSTIISIFLYHDIITNKKTLILELFKWISLADLSVNWGIRIDSLSITMILIINIVSSVVHLYSLGYMRDDKNLNRFLSYLSLFTFFMLVLVSSNNLLQLFVGWEGVGLCSYLLIGFWYKKETANIASFKAFIVNRIGDFAFIIGIIAIYVSVGSLYFDDIFLRFKESKELVTIFNINYVDFVAGSLLIGCMAKSSQFLLHTWLPDAMEGPTPVSALIHSATMVTAGIFLIIRMSPIFELSSNILFFMTVIGAITAFFAATIATVQDDIKKIIAYSTCSQLGYMFFACGLSAYSVSMFHLITHAFFKSLLFLTAGNIIIATNHEQNIKKMGGLMSKLPITFLFVVIASLAISGFPPFSGYYSKDLILEMALLSNNRGASFAYILGILSVFLTALYSARLIFLVFFKNKISGSIKKIEELPSMTIAPLIILVLGSIFMGYLGYNNLAMVGIDSSYFNNTIILDKENSFLKDIKTLSSLEKLLPLIISLFAVILAIYVFLYNNNILKFLITKFSYIHSILYRKYFIDELYKNIFINNYYKLSNFLSKIFDNRLIDMIIVIGSTRFTYNLARIVNKFQSGLVYHYAFFMIATMVCLISYFIIRYFFFY